MATDCSVNCGPARESLVDQGPTPLHTHFCTNPKHGQAGMSWPCEHNNCYRPLAQDVCLVCEPAMYTAWPPLPS